jgi:hypothetical protein
LPLAEVVEVVVVVVALDVVVVVEMTEVDVVAVEDVADAGVVLVVVEDEQEAISSVVTMMDVTMMPTIPFFICPPLLNNNL